MEGIAVGILLDVCVVLDCILFYFQKRLDTNSYYFETFFSFRQAIVYLLFRGEATEQDLAEAGHKGR
jgi:hypothetical protein